ncbi:MAG: hypothetical protein IJ583_11635, partial [Firmicutes bacterium]|nr:hypothetical protein [Bacillota bacterium]
MTREEKIKNTRELYDRSISEITSSPTAWADFLKTSANFYKHTFDDQLLIIKQDADATAVAQFDDWNNKMNRQIKHGSKGIPVLRKNADGTDNIAYMYDVSDTERRNEKSREPYIWKMSEDYKEETALRLAKKYKLDKSFSLEEILDKISSNYTLEYSKRKDSFPFSFVVDSVKYAAYSRCGLDTSSFERDLFFNFEMSNKSDFSEYIRNSINQICKSILRSVEVEVKSITAEREKTNINKKEETKQAKKKENTHEINTDEKRIIKINELLSEINTLYGELSENEKAKLPDISNLFNGNTSQIKEKYNRQNHFTDSEIEIAKNTNIVDYLVSKGEILKAVGKDEYELSSHDSMRISSEKGFYWNSKNVGGNAIDFCMIYYGMDFKSAVTELLEFNGKGLENTQSKDSKTQEKIKEKHNP